MKGFHTIFFFKKTQLEVGEIVIDFFHPLVDHNVMEFLCTFSINGIFVTAIAPTSNWNFLKRFAFWEHLDDSRGMNDNYFGLHKNFDSPLAKLNIGKRKKYILIILPTEHIGLIWDIGVHDDFLMKIRLFLIWINMNFFTQYRSKS